MRSWIKRILIGLGVLVLALTAYAAFAPLAEDTLPPPDQYGAGASSVLPAYSGLQREFPKLNEPADNPATPDKIALGQLLFFDSILSKDRSMSCATCHSPDLGFADGRPLARGGDGTDLQRGALSLWNVGYENSFFWDGRVATLEEQMLVPFTSSGEMAASPEEIEARLRAIPAYVALFDKAFNGQGSQAVAMDNVQKAVASYERSLIAKSSPFDRYAAGQFEALAAQQRRGLGVFRSAATACFECHAAPTFGGDGFFVTGVPDAPGQPHDKGRAAVAADALDGAFKAPSLRNIALTAPYMHNGVFTTLEQVVDFYSKGGGRPAGVQNVDAHVVGFDITPQEQADLISFLYALTDDQALSVDFPKRVPSGLPLVVHKKNPAAALVQQVNVPVAELSQGTKHVATTIVVQPGETIQSAADRARSGDTIQVPYGTYHEHVVIDWSDIKLIGMPNEAGQLPTLDGDGKYADGVIASGNNFEMANFHIVNYTSNGILVEGASGVNLHDLLIEDTGTYGVYPTRSSNILMERIETVGMNDGGLYAGKCENVTIRGNLTHDNVIGIEVENSVNVDIYDNQTRDNTLGVSVIVLPNLPSKVSLNTKVHDNIIENNNGRNFAPAGGYTTRIPSGSGVLIFGADRVEVFNNTIRGNKTAGIGVFNLSLNFDISKVDVGPYPEHNRIHDNTIEGNGYDAGGLIRDMLGRGYDIIWDGTGADNTFVQPGVSSFPPELPSPSWPGPLYNLLVRVMQLVTAVVG